MLRRLGRVLLPICLGDINQMSRYDMHLKIQNRQKERYDYVKPGPVHLSLRHEQKGHRTKRIRREKEKKEKKPEVRTR